MVIASGGTPREEGYPMRLRAFVQQLLILQDRIPVSSWDRPMEFTTMDGTVRYVAVLLEVANGRVRVTLDRKA